MFGSLLKKLLDTRNPEDVLRERLAAWSSWLEPLEANGVGRDPANEDAFFAIKDEVTRLSGTDDALIARSCEHLLKTVGKDLRVAGFYVFARLRQGGTTGFADGLELIAALVDRFGDTLLPARAEAKKGALDWLASTRMIDQLGRYDAFAGDDLERVVAALDLLSTQAGQWPEAIRPNLQPLAARFAAPQASAHASGVSVPETAPAESPTPVAAVGSARELLDQARAMSAYLREQEGGYLPSVRMVRCVRWDTLHEVPPADRKARTRLVAPRAELGPQFKRLILQKQWHEVLDRVEGAFMEGANHLWLDLSYFQHVALDHAGTPYREWRKPVFADLLQLTERLPGIERLAFSDGTPFAEEATLEWMAQHADARDTRGESLKPLPAGETEAGHWQEMEAQARVLLDSEGLDAAFAWLTGLPDIRSDRQRFLQRWLMARLADKAGRCDTAGHLLDELDGIGRHLDLARWEPALSFEVKQHRLRVVRQLMNRKGVDRLALSQCAETLYAELTVLDPARAVAVN